MAARSIDALVRSLVVQHPGDAARFLESLPSDEAAELAAGLSPRALSKVTDQLAPETAVAVLSRIGPARANRLLESLPPRRAAAVLGRLDAALQETALAGVSERTARTLRELLAYPPGTAGALMDPQVVALNVQMTARQAISALRSAPRVALVYLYVVDDDGCLAGVVNMRDLLLAEPRAPIEPMLHREVLTLPPSATRDEVADLIQESGFVALPVVDPEGHLLGVVRHDQVLATVRAEAFSDLQKMVGAGSDEKAMSSVGTVVRKRLPWLLVNLVTAFLAAAVVGLFESTIARVTALAVLLPIVAGQGGNTGAQALAVVMRGLALREVLPGTEAALLRKEIFGALLNGVAVAAVTSLAVLLWDGRLALAAVIGGAMIVNMTGAGLAGASIPLLLKRFGQDPAQSSSIFMTTVTDVVGFASFLGFAMLMMPYLEG